MSDASGLAGADYANPERLCDVVMKGGITSGVVYPRAVCELARTYRFKSVGGTSAGAIAAAAAAAAEYGRGVEGGGFNELAALPDEIGAEGKLLSLFAPQPSTRRLFAVLTGSLQGGPLGAAWAALRGQPLAALLGALPGLALLALAVGDLSGGFSVLAVVAIVLALAIALLGAALFVAFRLLRQLQRAVPDNGFGICSGGPEGGGGPPPLTVWLHERINALAGLAAEEPLTFGHLWAGPDGDPSRRPGDSDERELRLAMMTTNLTNRRAHRLPWDDREWLFDPQEFRRLFPGPVVDWMEAHPPQPSGDGPAAAARSQLRWALARPLLPLPAAADLPVIVATRMSLSFPVLLSAVPLWRFDWSLRENGAAFRAWTDWAAQRGPGWTPPEGAPEDWPFEDMPGSRPAAERCWFSDGGISSNFPVQFFDRLVPRWPTFAINLRPFHPDQAPDPEVQANNVAMPARNNDEIRDWWYRLPARPSGLAALFDARLVGFLGSAVRTMQNRVDEAQMRAPGYRDRIAHVELSDTEGGMNLTMPPQRIAALTERGRAAAVLLREAYTPPDPPEKAISWDNHRWVRLRSTLAVLEEMHASFGDGYDGEVVIEDERSYGELLARGEAPPDSYPLLAGQLEAAEREVAAIRAAIAAAEAGVPLRRQAPRPEPEGRITPRT